MNNPFHRAAVKAFRDVVSEFLAELAHNGDVRLTVHDLTYHFERQLEDQARAFDACKTGTEISMTTLSHEMLKALYLVKARLKIDGNWPAAERAFNDHMKPHFEIRLW